MDINDKIKNLPTKSGVYLFKDDLGRIIYIGKANNLRSRVRSYFQSPGTDISPKILWLRNQISDLDYIIVNSPIEALILEANLIRRYKPYFNAQRKDDKRYPLIEITVYEDYPRMRIVRHANNKKSRYFGPYTNSRAMRKTFKLIQKTFKIRTCKYDLEKPLSRPCLDYHINLCPSPCVGYIDNLRYNKLVTRASQFLDGKTRELLRSLRNEMEECSLKLEFEKCAILRDLMKSIQIATDRQQVVTKPGEDMDFIGICRENDMAGISLLEIRDGKILNQKKFIIAIPLEEEISSLLRGFIIQAYREGFFIPPDVYLQERPEDQEEIEDFISGMRGGRVHIRIPLRGDKKKIMDIAVTNARLHLQMKTSMAKRNMEKHKEELDHLQSILSLNNIPHRIEGFDISNISGKMAVASMVVFGDGEPLSEHYRRFKIKGGDEPDDFSMMNEALTRRFKNLKLGELESFREKPDLILIDGGKGQLSAVLKAARDMDIEGIPIISLAKRDEEVYLPGMKEPLPVEKDSPGLKLLRQVRDEAHRFAVSYHRKLRSKKMEVSILDGIPGVARKRKETLLQHFDSIEDIGNATLYELQELPGFNRKVAEQVLRYLGSR